MQLLTTETFEGCKISSDFTLAHAVKYEMNEWKIGTLWYIVGVHRLKQYLTMHSSFVLTGFIVLFGS